MTHTEMIFPQPLKPGDKVAILSPASYIDPARVAGAATVLHQWGFTPVIYPHCNSRCGTYSGSIEERRDDLLHALSDPGIRAILCSRGGYGTVHLLPWLDSELLRRDPKWIIGFSDISALHAAMVSAGIASIHSSMTKLLAERGGDDPCSRMLLDVLQGRLPCHEVPPHPLNRCGEATAMIVGGNLAVLSGLVSTPFDILRPGRILFIEDISEEVYRVERMLYTLRLNGTLARLCGLIVGRFTNYHNPDRNGDSMEQMIARITAPYGYPVAMGFPIGHIDDNRPVIEGAQATLTVTATSSTLQFHHKALD